MKKLMLGAAVIGAIASSGCASFATTSTDNGQSVASSVRVDPQVVFNDAKDECAVDAASHDTSEASSIANVRGEFDSRFADAAEAGCRAAFR
jgi:hypothetical protein